MRCKKHNFSIRRIHFIVRLVTLLLQIIILIAGIIALASYTAKVLFVLLPYTLIPIIGWAFTIGWIIVYDIYLTCLTRRYWNKAAHKTSKPSHHNAAPLNVTAGPFMPQY